MAQGQAPGDKIFERIRARAKLTGQNTEQLAKRYVLERALYRLVEAYGARLMLKGSVIAVIDDPDNARPAPDADVHLKNIEDLQLVVPDLLTRTYYNSASPTGLLEDHVTFTAFRWKPLQHSGGQGTKLRLEAMLGNTRVNVSMDFGFGHGHVSALEVKEDSRHVQGAASGPGLMPASRRRARRQDQGGAGVPHGLDAREGPLRHRFPHPARQLRPRGRRQGAGDERRPDRIPAAVRHARICGTPRSDGAVLACEGGPPGLPQPLRGLRRDQAARGSGMPSRGSPAASGPQRGSGPAACLVPLTAGNPTIPERMPSAQRPQASGPAAAIS